MGVEDGVWALSLRSMGELSPFLAYKTSVILYTTGTLHFSRWFSIVLVSGMRVRSVRKYRMDAAWPIMM